MIHDTFLRILSRKGEKRTRNREQDQEHDVSPNVFTFFLLTSKIIKVDYKKYKKP